jgi:hypothetical protein
MRGRAVILLEPGDRRTREIGLEAQDVADLGAAPAIDRLIIVADAAQIQLLGQEPQPQIARRWCPDTRRRADNTSLIIGMSDCR